MEATNTNYRRPLIIGNWKMNTTLAEADPLAREISQAVGSRVDTQVVLCPPFTVLFAVSQLLGGSTVELGAQNLYPGPTGAVTGEICAEMLKALYCSYVLVGHSERRLLLGETDTLINQKIHAALNNRLKPVLCIGESLEAKETQKTWQVLEAQLKNGLEGVPSEMAEQVIIAYEPVWAIGSGKAATPQDAQAVHAQVRSWFEGQYGSALSTKLRVLYGGSVNPSNVRALLEQPDIDGALVGGVALKAREFLSLL